MKNEEWSTAISKAGVNVNGKLAEKLHKEEQTTPGFKITFGQQI